MWNHFSGLAERDHQLAREALISFAEPAIEGPIGDHAADGFFATVEARNATARRRQAVGQTKRQSRPAR